MEVAEYNVDIPVLNVFDESDTWQCRRISAMFIVI